jgi:hypothetical protein
MLDGSSRHGQSKGGPLKMKPWWGEFEFALGQTLRWQIGPKALSISRAEGEWIVASEEGRDRLDRRLTVAEAAAKLIGDEVDVERFAVRDDSRTLRLVPALPDRPLIVNTAKPFFVPANEAATLYVSVPLWFRVLLAGSDAELVDSATARPSDTWFGPDTLSGEFCYASRTNARLHMGDLPFRPHRAVSTVRIRNYAASTLPLEKLKVPVQNLSLFASDEGHLWTETLTLERKENSENASIRLDSKPDHGVAATPVAPPRSKISKGFVLDVFGRLFGSEKGEKG